MQIESFWSVKMPKHIQKGHYVGVLHAVSVQTLGTQK